MVQIQEHILTDIPVFDIGEPVSAVVGFFERQAYSHVAITEAGEYLGAIGENDLLGLEPGSDLGRYRYDLDAFMVTRDSSWLDVLETFARNEANLLPVVDDNKSVVGYYDLRDVVSAFIDTPFFTEPGAILVVAKGEKDYSFSEIAQIVESNNIKMIGGFVSDIRNDVVQVTLKIGNTNLNEVIQSFRRYNYHILFGNKDDQFLEDLRQRSEYLDKYLKV